MCNLQVLKIKADENHQQIQVVANLERMGYFLLNRFFFSFLFVGDVDPAASVISLGPVSLMLWIVESSSN